MKDGQIVSLEGEHNHFADPVKIQHLKVIQKAKEELRSNPLSSIREVINNAEAGEEEVVIATLDKENLRRRLSREKTVRLHRVIPRQQTIKAVSEAQSIPKRTNRPSPTQDSC
jgi:hypothetical protein